MPIGPISLKNGVRDEPMHLQGEPGVAGSVRAEPLCARESRLLQRGAEKLPRCRVAPSARLPEREPQSGVLT